MDWFGGDWDWWEFRNRPRIKEEYGEKLRAQSQFVEAVAPATERSGRIMRKDRQIDTRFFGTTPEYLATNDAIEIAKDYRTDVYWESEVGWRYADWARQSGDRRDRAAVA